jgi:hypothetical protein
MKTIELKMGKKIEVEIGNDYFTSNNTNFHLDIIKGEKVIITRIASKELAKVLNIPIAGKENAFRISDSVYKELESDMKEIANKENEEKENYLLSRPHQKVLMFSGNYLMDPARIIDVYQKEDDLWYISETIYNVPKLTNRKETINSFGLVSEIEINCNCESWSFIVSDKQIENIVAENNKLQKIEDDAKQEKIIDAETKRNELIEKAKAENKKQEYKRYSVSCDHSVEECSTDIITEYILPNGNIEYKRTHTF